VGQSPRGDQQRRLELTYEKALATPCRFGEDGIAGITDQNLSVSFAFAFFQSGQPYLTEQLYGLDGPRRRSPDRMDGAGDEPDSRGICKTQVVAISESRVSQSEEFQP